MASADNIDVAVSGRADRGAVVTPEEEAVRLVMTDREEWDALRRIVSTADSAVLVHRSEPGIAHSSTAMPAGIIAALMDALDAERAGAGRLREELDEANNALAALCVLHYYDGSQHRNSDPDCRVCRSLQPYIKRQNDEAWAALDAEPGQPSPKGAAE